MLLTDEATSVDPEQDWSQILLIPILWNIRSLDVQEQAVLACDGCGSTGLEALWTVCGCIKYLACLGIQRRVLEAVRLVCKRNSRESE